VETMHYHITTQFWVLIGNHRNLRQLSISIVVLEEIL
jgi:hypothetical protein